MNCPNCHKTPLDLRVCSCIGGKYEVEVCPSCGDAYDPSLIDDRAGQDCDDCPEAYYESDTGYRGCRMKDQGCRCEAMLIQKGR